MDYNKPKNTRKSVFIKMIEDKKAIRECIRNRGDLNQLANERGIIFAKPI